MKAINLSGYAPGGERKILAEALPLRTPYLVEFFVSYPCNFKCVYCIHSVPNDKRGYISDTPFMSLQLYKKCIDDMTKFPDKVKMLRFAGMGEPLMHKDIVGMVAYATHRGVAERIEILTNGSLLTNKLSDALINAGLTRLFISLQGLSSERYFEVCGKRIDFDKLVDGIRYYYDNKKSSTIHIKMMDYALTNDEDKAKFFEIFGDICDTIDIEVASPIYPYVEYDKILNSENNTNTQFGLKVKDIKVCPQPFFRVHVIPDGQIIPCYSMAYPIFIGNCIGRSLVDIWNGDKLKEFRNDMLNQGLGFNDVCKSCEIIRHRLFSEDILDNDIERLKEVYK